MNRVRLVAGACIWLLANSALAQNNYDSLVDRANALAKSGEYDKAIALYTQGLEQQQRLCRKPPKISKLSQLSKKSPCWRMMMLQFNIALARKSQGDAVKTALAYAFYLRQWRDAFPQIRGYPFEERARFEWAQAEFKRGRYQVALNAYRDALSRWYARYPKQHPRFADDANRRIAECYEKLGRRLDAKNAYQALIASYKKRTGQDHPDQAYFQRRIAQLSQPQKGKVPPPKLAEQPAPSPEPRSKLWFGLAIGGIAVAAIAEAAAIGLTVKANDTFNTDPDFDGLRAGAIAAHVVAGVAAVGAILSLIIHVRPRESKSAGIEGLRIGVVPTKRGGQASVGWRF